MDAKNDLSDREIVVTRQFDAPRELVWKAWTSSEHINAWWGPRGFTTTTHAMDVRPGGIWRFVMHGPDGTDWDNKIEYIEVVKPQRLVYNHGGGDDDPTQFHVTVTFDEQGDRTGVTMRSLFASAEVKKQMVEEVGAIEGANQTLDRLGESLATLVSPETEFVISRVVDAPRDLVWKVHSEAEHLMHWWGPKGFRMRVANLDFRQNGTFHYHLQAAGGAEMWGKFVYREIARPRRIVFVNSFSDPEGNVTRAPFAESWPLEMLNTMTFEELGEQTKITIRSVPWKATEAERKTFLDGHKSMQGGYGGTFDQLAAYLAEVSTSVK